MKKHFYSPMFLAIFLLGLFTTNIQAQTPSSSGRATISLTFTNTEPLCYFSTNGNIIVTVSGGTAPYSYLWSDNSTSDTLKNVGAGTYSVTVTDANSATVADSDSLGQPQFVSGFVNTFPSSGTDGMAIISANGGTPPYTYLWNDGQTTDTAFNLAPGNYDVTTTDNHGCTDHRSGVVGTAGASITITFANIEPLCFMSTNGSIVASATGGTAPYSYLWSDNSTSDTLKNVGTGTYSVTVTDANSNTATDADSLGQPQFVTGHVTTSASHGNDGMAIISSSGGTPPYTYLWNDGQTTDTIINLAPGTYDVTTTDNHGCTDHRSGVVDDISGIYDVQNALDNFDVYPNPTEATLNLKFTLTKEESLQIRVVDVSGKIVYTEKATLSGNVQHAINVSELAKGSYILQVLTTNGISRKGFVVSH